MRHSHRSVFFSLLTIFALVGGLAAPALRTSASATAPVEMQSMPGQLVYFYAAHTDQPAPKIPPPAGFLQQRANGVRTQTATITVNYNPGFSPEAQAAFQLAVDIWTSLITSPVPITVDAYWTPLPTGVLGGAGSLDYEVNFAGVPMADTGYPVAIANKWASTDLEPGDYDIEADFNSNFPDWYFGTDGNTPLDKWDFASVVLHELGHGLGFTGSMRVGGYCGSGNGCWGVNSHGFLTGYPAIYDRFAVNGLGQPLISSFANNSPELAAQLTSGSIYFNGPNAVKANGSSNVNLYAPNPWRQGSSYAHLGEIFNGTPNALMTFSISNGESLHNPGPVMLCMFKDMGWTAAVSGSSAASASVASAPGFTAFGPDNVTVMVTETLYLPLVMNGGDC